MEETKQTLKDNATLRWLVLLAVISFLFSTYWLQNSCYGFKPIVEADFGFSTKQLVSMIVQTPITNMLGIFFVGGIILNKLSVRIT